MQKFLQQRELILTHPWVSYRDLLHSTITHNSITVIKPNDSYKRNPKTSRQSLRSSRPKTERRNQNDQIVKTTLAFDSSAKNSTLRHSDAISDV